MKRKHSLAPMALLAFSLVGGLTLSGCSFFTDPEEGYTIKEVQKKQLDNGDWNIKIIYANENKVATEFTIPAAVSVDKITPSYDEETRTWTITITKTDDSKPAEFTIEPGISIDHIEAVDDKETGDIFLNIHYTDGSVQDGQKTGLRIPKGKDGDPGQDGKSILLVLTNVNEDLSTDVTIFVGYLPLDEEGNPVVMTKDNTVYDAEQEAWIVDEKYPFTGDVYSGINLSAGIGVDAEGTSMEYYKDGANKGDLKVTVLYTNGDKTVMTLTRPAYFWTHEGDPNEKFADDFDFDGVPLKEGDMYFDCRKDIAGKNEGQCFYRYNGSSWEMQMSLTDQDYQAYTVVFHINAPEGSDPVFLDGDHLDTHTELSRKVGRGRTTFYNEVTIPTAFDQKGIYTFGGWYTSNTYNYKHAPNPTVGAFTNMTPVWGNMSLYAYWTAEYRQVALDINGGEGGSTSIDVVYGVDLPTIDYLPTKKDATFVGYFDDPDAGTKYYDADGNPVHGPIAKDSEVTKLYAHYE